MFSRLTIGKKLGIGFGVTVVLLLVISVMSFSSLRDSSEGFTGYREMARDNNLVGLMQADMLMVRMNVKDYIITGSDKDKEQFNEHRESMHGYLKEAQVEIQNPERAAKVDYIEEEFAVYENAFDNVTALMDKRNEAVNGVLNVQGPFMEETLSKVLLSANEDGDLVAAFHTGLAMKHLLLARLHVVKFLENNEQGEVDIVHEEIELFEEETGILDRELENPQRRQWLAEVLDVQDVYLAAFDDAVSAITERNQIISSTLDRIGPEIAVAADEVKLSIKAVQDKLGPELVAANSQSITLIVILSVIAIVAGVGVAYFITRSISTPIQQMSKAAEEISEGNIRQNIDVKSSDEVGVLATAFNKLIAYMKELAGAAESIARNDLTVRVEPKSDDDVLGNSFKTMLHNLSGVVIQMDDNASQLVSAANEVASTSEQMSRGANDQTSQIGQVSSAVEEMAATIVETSRNAGEATDGAKGAAGTATSGGQIVNDTIQGMQRIAAVVRESAESIGKLAKSAESIGEIIGVIDDIADQTNLLALNAAIEAARAGEQGRGFAVVADEVRKLAERTGKATGEITAMIKGIQEETTEAVTSMETGISEVDSGRELADQAGASLTEIVNMSQSVQNMIEQIATAAEEQSVAAEQISKNVEAVSTIARESATGAEQSATAAEELNRQAEGMREMVSRFQVTRGQ